MPLSLPPSHCRISNGCCASRRCTASPTGAAGWPRNSARADLANLSVATLAARGILDPRWAIPHGWRHRCASRRASITSACSNAVCCASRQSERAQWREEFARAFAPCALHDAGARGFLLTGIAPTPRSRRSIPRACSTRILAPALPSGAAARELRRLGAEIEMWLHAAPPQSRTGTCGPAAPVVIVVVGRRSACMPRRARPHRRPRKIRCSNFMATIPAFAGIARAVGGRAARRGPVRVRCRARAARHARCRIDAHDWRRQSIVVGTRTSTGSLRPASP